MIELCTLHSDPRPHTYLLTPCSTSHPPTHLEVVVARRVLPAQRQRRLLLEGVKGQRRARLVHLQALTDHPGLVDQGAARAGLGL